MKHYSAKKLALAGMFCALAVVGSVFSFPVFGSKCAPVQHMVNILCAVLLGPYYGVGVAFVASLLRNLLGLGSLMAFPGSMCGALLCGCGQRETETEELPVLVIGSDNYEPYFYLDEDGAYAGIDVEIATAACERLGWTASFQKINWQEKDALLERGDVDCLWGSFSMNGREDRYRWAGPYMYTQRVVEVPADSEIETLEDLAEKSVAEQDGTISEEIILKGLKPN